MTSDTPGPSFLSVTLTDTAGNTGGTDFATNPLLASTTGKDGDTEAVSVEVFDQRGDSHFVNLTLQKQADGSWNATAAMNPADGTITTAAFRGFASTPTAPSRAWMAAEPVTPISSFSSPAHRLRKQSPLRSAAAASSMA
ncbi:MAG: hypothetical protein U0992_10785 [Planctomycetaceae bacterium]